MADQSKYLMMSSRLTIAGVLLFSISVGLSAQTGLKDNSIGLQMGNQGIWANYERAISKDFSVRTEIGLDVSVFRSTAFYRGGIEAAPVMRIEPRWYYNLNKKDGTGKSILGNAMSFLALQTTFRPGSSIGPRNHHERTFKKFSIAPMWGVRTMLNDHWSIEGGIGLEYFRSVQTQLSLDPLIGIGEKYQTTGLKPYWHLRVGYRF